MHPDSSVRGHGEDRRGLLRSSMWVYGSALASQAIGVVVQLLVAREFGAGMEMDAFVAANTLPQYIFAILNGVLSAVAIPAFVDCARKQGEESAWKVAHGLLNQCLLVSVLIVVLGMVFVSPVLRWSVPGLADNTRELAGRIALITWPALVTTGIASILTAVYQAREAFAWPAMAPLSGSVSQLILIPLLVPRWGILGLAAAATTGMVLQTLCLMLVMRGSRYSFSLQWNHPAIREVWRLMGPLLLMNVVVRWTPLVDRFLASRFPEGSIAHLNYAFRLVVLLSLLGGVGLSTALFPRLAADAADRNMAGLRQNISLGLRWLWLLVAPAISLGMVLALPLVTAIFQRGRFTPSDADAVAHLFQVYLPALVGMALGGVTGRVFYALKATRLLAVGGVVEALFYVVFTWLFSRIWGVSGIALGYTCYFSLSLCWQSPLIWHKVGRTGGRNTLYSFLRVTAAATGAGIVARLLIVPLVNPWMQLIVGGFGGGLAYVAILFLLRSDELNTLRAGIRSQWMALLRPNAGGVWP